MRRQLQAFLQEQLLHAGGQLCCSLPADFSLFQESLRACLHGCGQGQKAGAGAYRIEQLTWLGRETKTSELAFSVALQFFQQLFATAMPREITYKVWTEQRAETRQRYEQSAFPYYVLGECACLLLSEDCNLSIMSRNPALLRYLRELFTDRKQYAQLFMDELSKLKMPKQKTQATEAWQEIPWSGRLTAEAFVCAAESPVGEAGESAQVLRQLPLNTHAFPLAKGFSVSAEKHQVIFAWEGGKAFCLHSVELAAEVQAFFAWLQETHYVLTPVS